MDKRYKIILSIFILCLVMTVGIGVSFAYYTAVIENGEESRSIVSKSANLEITYTDGSKQIIGANVYHDWSETKTFTVKNTGDTDSAYAIKLTNIVNKFTVPGSISFSWTAKGGPADLDEYILPTVGTSETIRDITFIGVGETHEYTITTYYNNVNYDQSEDKGKSFSFTIEIESVKSWTPKGWNTAEKGTLLAGIKANYPKATNPLSDARTEGSFDGEAVLSPALDDYGTSYYFRGNVENNYVVFANMCWRIVRVTGDGSIKLALYNYESTSCDVVGGLNAFVHLNSELITTGFNTENYDWPSSVGLMYGTYNGRSYMATHNNKNKSDVLQYLETWYQTYLTSYTNKLADVIWCNDKNTIDGIDTYVYSNGELNSNYYPGLGYGQTEDYNVENRDNLFYPSMRMYGNITFEVDYYMSYGTGPSLICPTKNSYSSYSKYTVSDRTNGNGALTYKIGMLTVDELVLSGLSGPSVNMNKGDSLENYYTFLANNADENGYWTLSPNGVDLYTLSYTNFIANGNYVDYIVVADEMAIRPAVALNSSITISGGDGTQDNPFVIS